jgi:uncharacterized protein YktA (UPF0223 family)
METVKKPRTLSQRFADEVWAELKPKGYKRNGKNFIYTGKEVKTIVNIQGGKYSSRESAYSMLNISYGRLDKKIKSINDADFFHFRHNEYTDSDFFGVGYCHLKPYPISLDYTNDKEIADAIAILQKIEPIFRCETLKDVKDRYKSKMVIVPSHDEFWERTFGRLTESN